MDKITTESDVSLLLDKMQNPDKYIVFEENVQTQDILFLDKITNSLWVKKIRENGSVFRIVSYLTPQDVQDFPLIEEIHLLTKNGMEIVLSKDRFCFSENGMVLLVGRSLYKLQYGAYKEHSVTPSSRGDVLLFKTVLHSISYLFATDTQGNNPQCLGYRTKVLSDHCFKVLKGNVWMGYFINHHRLLFISAGIEKLTEVKRTLHCEMFDGSSQIWRYKRSSAKFEQVR